MTSKTARTATGLRLLRQITLRLAVVFLTFALAIPVSAAEPRDRDRLNFYIAAGTAWNFPGSVRIGTRVIEGGLIASGIGGIVYNLWDENVSVSLGLAGAGLGGTIGFGPYMAIGSQWSLFWILGLRGEVFAFGTHNGWVTGGAHAGLNLTF